MDTVKLKVIDTALGAEMKSRVITLAEYIRAVIAECDVQFDSYQDAHKYIIDELEKKCQPLKSNDTPTNSTS